LKGFTFTVLIFSSVSLAMFYPGYFIQIGTLRRTQNLCKPSQLSV
jgi:hypothetical protein